MTGATSQGIPRGADSGPVAGSRQAAASLAAFASGWLIDGINSNTWTEALFGHGDDGHSHHRAAVVAYGVSAVAGLAPMIPRAVASLRYLHLDMHVLVCLSAIGAAMIGQWAEAAAVAFLFAVAHPMEAWSIDRARHAVANLVGHEPGWGEDRGHESANVERWIEKFAAIYTPGSRSPPWPWRLARRLSMDAGRPGFIAASSSWRWPARVRW